MAILGTKQVAFLSQHLAGWLSSPLWSPFHPLSALSCALTQDDWPFVNSRSERFPESWMLTWPLRCPVYFNELILRVYLAFHSP